MEERRSMEKIISAKGIRKGFPVAGGDTFWALKGLDLEIARGQLAILKGRSGSGKTTLMNILSALDYPTEGEVFLQGSNIVEMSEKERGLLRRRKIGFVFQFYNLIPNLTAKENVELAAQTCTDVIPAEEILGSVGLGERLDNFPSQLSGGEQQRVAIARALAKKPKLLLCDEPTGALDYNTGKLILKLLQDTCRKSGMTVILVTHNSAIAPMADRIIYLKNSRVSRVELNASPTPVEEIEW